MKAVICNAKIHMTAILLCELIAKDFSALFSVASVSAPVSVA